MKKIIELYANDRALFVVFTIPLVRIMWRKTSKDEVVFSPFSMYKGWKIEKGHVPYCLILSIIYWLLFYLLVLAPVFSISPYRSLLHSFIFYIVAFSIFSIVYYIITRLFLYRIGAQVVKTKERTKPISTLDFRSYLRKLA